MPTLDHSPAIILQNWLVNTAGVGTLPSGGGSWPVYAKYDPENVDDRILIVGREGIKSGKTQYTKEVLLHRGIQILVTGRRTVDDTTWLKAQEVTDALDSMTRQTLTIDSSTYTLWGVTRVGDTIPLGVQDQNHLSRFSINCLLSVHKN